MSYYVLTGKCTFISRTTVQQVTNLELQVDSNKLLYKEFDQEVRRILGEEEPQQDIGDKPSPEDWAEFMEFDEDFQEEFSNIISNDDIKEADEEFTPEVFDDTYLNMELALPSKDGAEPAFARVTKRLEMQMDCRLAPRMTTPFSTLECMRSSTKTVTGWQWQRMQLLRTSLRRLMQKAIVKFSLMRSLITVPMGRRLSSKTRF